MSAANAKNWIGSERPLWRWWLFCAATDIYYATNSKRALDVMAWCVLPEWLGWQE